MAKALAVEKGAAGDNTVTERFCAEVLLGHAPALAVLWLSEPDYTEPDYTGHHTPLSLPEYKRAIAAANGNVRRVTKTVALLDPAAENTIRRRLRLRRVLFIAPHGIAA